MDPDQKQSDLGPHCLPVCKNRFEKFARVFSRRRKQTTFSDVGFLGVLRVNPFMLSEFAYLNYSDTSISNSRSIRMIFLLLYSKEIPVLNANSVDLIIHRIIYGV